MFVAAVERWRSSIDRHPGARPVDFHLSWISVESAGNVRATGLASLDERGLYQISRDEATEILHLTADEFDRVAYDGDYSIDQGVALAAEYEARASAEAPWATGDAHLAATKLFHGASGVASWLFAHVPADLHRDPASWSDFDAGARRLAASSSAPSSVRRYTPFILNNAAAVLAGMGGAPAPAAASVGLWGFFALVVARVLGRRR